MKINFGLLHDWTGGSAGIVRPVPRGGKLPCVLWRMNFIAVATEFHRQMWLG